MEEDYRPVEGYLEEHKFYVIPKPPKEKIRNLHTDIYLLEIERREVKKGGIVRTFVVPILRKGTKKPDNVFSPALLFLKVLFRRGEKPKIYYNIVKIPNIVDFVIMATWLKKHALREWKRWEEYPTVSLRDVVEIIVRRLTKGLSLEEFLGGGENG